MRKILTVMIAFGLFSTGYNIAWAADDFNQKDLANIEEWAKERDQLAVEFISGQLSGKKTSDPAMISLFARIADSEASIRAMIGSQPDLMRRYLLTRGMGNFDPNNFGSKVLEKRLKKTDVWAVDSTFRGQTFTYRKK